jgi:glutathione S-transferase
MGDNIGDRVSRVCAGFAPDACRFVHSLCEAVAVLELWQAEWCPYSHRVRMRLTELELDWIARVVPVSRSDRARLERATDVAGIPTLVDGEHVVHGADAILAHLDAHAGDPTVAARHRAQMRAEWPHWVALEGT